MLGLKGHFKLATLLLVLAGGVFAISVNNDSPEKDICDRNDQIFITNPQTNNIVQVERGEFVLDYAKQFLDGNEFTFSMEQEDILVKKWCDYSKLAEQSGDEAQTLKVLKDMNNDFQNTVDRFYSESSRTLSYNNASKLVP